jgi:hypothetical protein
VSAPNILARKSEEGPLPYCETEPNQRVSVDWVPMSMYRETIDSSERRKQIYENNIRVYRCIT